MSARSAVLAPLAAILLAALATPGVAQRLKLPVKFEQLEARARADSNDAAAHYNLGLGYWSKDRYKEAEDEFELAIEIDRRFADGYLALSQLPYARRPKLWEEIRDSRVPEEWVAVLEESDRLYRLAFMIDPLVDLKIMGAVTPRKSIYWEQIPELALVYATFYGWFDDVLEGDYDRAYFRLENLIDDANWDRDRSRTPTDVLWFHALAAAHIQNWQQAIADVSMLLERSLEEERGDQLIQVPLKTNDYRYLLAALTNEAYMPDEAIALYRETLATDIGLYMAHVQIGRIYESRGQWLRAADEFQRAVAINPDDPSLLYDLGVTLGRGNRLREAEEILLQARQANPRDPRVPYVLGLVQISLNNNEAARESFQQFIEMAPSRYQSQMDDARRRLAAIQESLR